MALDPALAQQLVDRGDISSDFYNKIINPLDNQPVLDVPVEKSAPSAADNFINNAKEAGSKIGSAIANRAKESFSLTAPGQLLTATDAIKAGAKSIGAKIVNEAGELTKPGYFDQRAPQAVTAPEDVVETVDPATLATTQAPAMAASQSIRSGPVGSGGGGLAGAFNQQKAAIMDAAKVGAEQASAEAAYSQTAYDEAEKMRVANEQKELQRADKLKDYETKLNTALEGYAAQPKTIGDKFANASTGQKILMGISLFLGAAPNSSGQNKAVAVMQNALDKDMEASKGLIDSKQSIYKEMRNTFSDDRQADAAARLAYINNTQLKLNQIAAQYKSPLVLKNAQILGSQLEVAKQQELAKFAKASDATIIPGADLMTQKIMQYPQQLQKELFEAREVYDATQAARKQFDQIYGAFDVGAGGYVPYTEDKAKLETTHARIESAIRATMKGQGTIQESEITRLVNPFLPLPTDSKERLAIKKAGLVTLLEGKNAGQINRLKNTGILEQRKELNPQAPVRYK